MSINPRWCKVMRDVLGNKTRTILVVLSIAVGVAGGHVERLAHRLRPDQPHARPPGCLRFYQ